MTRESFTEKVNAFTREKALFSLPSTVVVGVSGGADSMALLQALYSRREEGLCVHAAHVHHGLRGKEADRDERVVREYCARYGIPLHVEHADVRALAEEYGCGLEETGRRVRYAFFERVRRECNADCIATAHNADDVVETMLMHMVRGCGGSGLVGIPAKRGYIVRPLLSCTRAEIEAYCAQNAIVYVVDSSNADTTFMRNRVRHELLPMLRDINPSVDQAMRRLSASMTQDEELLTGLATAALDKARVTLESYSLPMLLQQPPAVRFRMWKMLLAQDGCFSFTERHVAALEDVAHAGHGTVCLPQGHYVTVSADRIKAACATAQEPLYMPVESLPMRFLLGGDEHRLQLLSREEYRSFQKVHKLFFKFAIDYDRIQGSLVIRGRREGDYIHLSHRQVGKPLKKLLLEQRVPRYQRDTYPLLCDDAGVLLMIGVGCDSRACPRESTKHFLVWTVNGEPSYSVMDTQLMDCTAIDDKE